MRVAVQIPYSMMLSTIQAQKHWEAVLKCLTEIKACAATQPDQLEIHFHVANQLRVSAALLERGLKTPAATWKQLLKQQVPRAVLAACSEVMVGCGYEAAKAAHCMAELLLRSADAHLPALEDTTTCSCSTCSSKSSISRNNKSSGSGLTAMLWEQIEQSGILQKLPAAFSSFASSLQQPEAKLGRSADVSTHAVSVMELLVWLKQLHPSFFTTHEFGTRCVVPAMQLGLSSLQYISRIYAQAGWRDWMEGWLNTIWAVASSAAYAAEKLQTQRLAQPVGTTTSSSSSSSSSRAVHQASPQTASSSSLRAAASEVVQAVESTQWTCIQVVMTMQLGSVQQVSSSRSSGSNGSRTSSSSQRRQHLNTESGPGEHLSAAATATLAASMPAECSSLLGQVGCSREVILLLAFQVNKIFIRVRCGDQGNSLSQMQQWADEMVADGVSMLRGSLRFGATQTLAKLAALCMSMPAFIMQWLADLPTSRLLQVPRKVNDVSNTAAVAYSMGLCMILQQRQLSWWQRVDPAPETASAAAAAAALAQSQQQMVAANSAVGQLSLTVLQKLLTICRSFPDSSGVGIFGSDSSSSSLLSRLGFVGSNSSSSALTVSCQHVVSLLVSTCTLPIQRYPGASSAFSRSSRSSSNSTPNTPAPGMLQCCTLMQDCIRLVVAAAAAGRPGSIEKGYSKSVFGSLASLVGKMEYDSDTSQIYMGSLMAPILAAEGVSSPAAMQLFGLLCSLLKLFNSSSSSSSNSSSSSRGSTAVAAVLAAGIPAEELWKVIMSAQVAVTSMLQAACDTSNPARSCTASSAACQVTAALPWVVLLGRCCHASAVLMQHLQDSLETSGASGRDSGSAASILHSFGVSGLAASILHSVSGASILSAASILALIENLEQLQSSFAGVAHWLAAADTQQKLNDMGYNITDLQQQQSEVAEALRRSDTELLIAGASATTTTTTSSSSSTSGGRSAFSAVLQAAQEKLHEAGAALACFAIPQACNNPVCSNVCGPSEAQLVGGRSCICGGCLKTRYCSRACQRSAWRQHKPVCAALAAAAAAKAAGDKSAAG